MWGLTHGIQYGHTRNLKSIGKKPAMRTLRVSIFWWLGAESNRRHADFQFFKREYYSEKYFFTSQLSLLLLKSAFYPMPRVCPDRQFTLPKAPEDDQKNNLNLNFRSFYD